MGSSQDLLETQRIGTRILFFGQLPFAGFPKLGVPFLAIIRMIVFWGLYWGPPILGNPFFRISWPRQPSWCGPLQVQDGSLSIEMYKVLGLWV